MLQFYKTLDRSKLEYCSLTGIQRSQHRYALPGCCIIVYCGRWVTVVHSGMKYELTRTSRPTC